MSFHPISHGTVVGIVLGALVALGCSDDSPLGQGGTGGGGQIPEVPVDVAEIAVTEPGEPMGGVVEVELPVTGGVVESLDGRLTIEVPAGALGEPTPITIQPVTNGCPGALGVAYRLGPEGQTFDAPVKVVYHYADSDVQGSEAPALRIAYHGGDGHWNSIKDIALDESAKTVTAETTHFSDWAPYTGWKLSPTSAMTAPGKFVALQVKVCSADDQGSDDLAAWVSTCAPDPSFLAGAWAVNGVEGGSPATGTVSGSQMNGTAQFLAPDQAPPANPVAVSVAVTEPSGRTTVLASNVWIDDHPPLRGSIASLQINPQDSNDFFTTTAQVGFKWNYDNEQYEVESGTFIARHDQKNPGGALCEIHTTFEGSVGVQDGAIYFQDGVYFPNGRTLGSFVGTTSCTSSGATQALTVYGSAIWWPAPLSSNLTPKEGGALEESLVGLMAHGSKVNVVWNVRPQ